MNKNILFLLITLSSMQYALLSFGMDQQNDNHDKNQQQEHQTLEQLQQKAKEQQEQAQRKIEQLQQQKQEQRTTKYLQQQQKKQEEKIDKLTNHILQQGIDNKNKSTQSDSMPKQIALAGCVAASQNFGAEIGKRAAQDLIRKVFGKSEEEKLTIFREQVSISGNIVNKTVTIGQAINRYQSYLHDIKSNDKIDEDYKKDIEVKLKKLTTEENEYLNDLYRLRKQNSDQIRRSEDMEKN